MKDFFFILLGSLILKTYFFEAYFNYPTGNINNLKILLIFIKNTINFKYRFRLLLLMNLLHNTLYKFSAQK